MGSTIKEILTKIESLNNDLREEYDRLASKYGFYFEQKKIVFLEEVRKRNREFRLPAWQYVLYTNVKHLLAMPFIYGMIIPTILLDIFLFIYQWTVFSLYRIPRVRRSDYITYERRFLDYLNIIQKINCLYCSYVNGVFAYAVEVGARTERYWCPIKAAHRPKFSHNWYKDFADYGNPTEWDQKFHDEHQAFLDVYGDKCFIKK